MGHPKIYKGRLVMVNEVTTLDRILFAIEHHKNFVLEAGAGSGKTYTLIQTLQFLNDVEIIGNQKVLCITYTNVAKEEIISRLNMISAGDRYIVSTMHEFLWGFFSSFQNELQKEVKVLAISRISKLTDEINEARRKLEKPRANTNIEKQRTIIEENDRKILKYDGVDFSSLSIVYDNYTALYRGVISHDDVIEIANSFFQKEFFVKLFVSCFPYVFIDEYQDTNYNLIANIVNKTNEYGFSNRITIGLFGDKMQQIYDNKGELDISVFDEVIQKLENYRSNSKIINANNILRSDSLIQSGDCQKAKVEFNKLQFIYNTSDDIDLRSLLNTEFKDYKRLYLSNKNIADEIGFRELSDLFSAKYNQNANEKLLKLDDPLINFILNNILISMKLFEVGDFSSLMQLLRVKSVKELEHSNSEIKKLFTKLDISILEFKRIYSNHFLLDESRFKKIIESYDDIEFVERLLSIKTQEFANLSKQIWGETQLSTMHGVKGAEFKNVIVNLFEGQPWSKYDFDSIINNHERIKTSVLRAHKLFYVACTRAEHGLVINYVCKEYSEEQENLLKESIRFSLGTDIQFKVFKKLDNQKDYEN
mgnify:CR=1 FL=1